jgi:hypothetical protein
LDAPSSYSAMIARLGAMMRSRTRAVSAGCVASSRSVATQICRSQIDSMYVLKNNRVGPSTLSTLG